MGYTAQLVGLSAPDRELTQALGSENAESHHQTIWEFPNNTLKKKKNALTQYLIGQNEMIMDPHNITFYSKYTK